MRALKILAGMILAIGSFQGGSFAGFYSPGNAQLIGFDLAKAAIYCLSGWLIYRGCKPTERVPNDGPDKGIIYTKSEIEDFKRRGLM
jgi:hypothetical protein